MDQKNAASAKRKTPPSNGKKKVKGELSKESFLAQVSKLKLYSNEDRYYQEVKTDVAPLELDWR